MSNEIEAVYAHPDVAQPEGFLTLVGAFVRPVTHAYVNSLVGRRTEILSLVVRVWRTERQSVSVRQFQSHFPSVGAGEVVREEQVYRITLSVGIGIS